VQEKKTQEGDNSCHRLLRCPATTPQQHRSAVVQRNKKKHEEGDGVAAVAFFVDM